MSIMHTPMPQTYYPQPQFIAPSQPVYQAPAQQMQMPQPSPTISNIYYVQGEAAAKAYPVAFGKGIVLFDSERDYFYIKEVDQSGVPKPLRKFPYHEETNEQTPTTVQLQQPVQQTAETKPDYITRNEFEKRLSELKIVEPKVTKETPVTEESENG